MIPSDGDGLDEEERGALHSDLDGSWVQAEARQTRPAEEVVRELRARYGGRTNEPELVVDDIKKQQAASFKAKL